MNRNQAMRDKDHIDIDQLTPRAKAQRHVRELSSFYQSLIAYLLVNIILLAIHVFGRPIPWGIWISFGWGVGLAIKASRLFADKRGMFFGEAWQTKKIEAILARENLKTMSSEKRLVQAQLQLLQAQIEPHFLFNTLANVQSLIGKSPDKATLMLGNFIAYLRQSLSASRNLDGTLQQEIDLIKNYLDLIKIRMGDRLQYQLDVDPSLTSQSLAPMLLQPIVENAIKHGLEPKVQGGTLSISVKKVSDMMQIIIADDGLGFGQKPGSGVGLSNLRERLQVMYDGQANINIIDAGAGTLGHVPSSMSVKPLAESSSGSLGGTRVELLIPLSTE